MMTSSMETFSALLAICAGSSLVTGEFLAQRPVTRIFDVLFHLRLNKRLSKQSWGWWFETLSRPLWRHCNAGKLLSGRLCGSWLRYTVTCIVLRLIIGRFSKEFVCALGKCNLFLIWLSRWYQMHPTIYRPRLVENDKMRPAKVSGFPLPMFDSTIMITWLMFVFSLISTHYEPIH